MTADFSIEDSSCFVEETITIKPPPRFRRCMTNALSDSQLQIIERESANRSLFAREIVVGTLSQALPDINQQQQQNGGSSSTTTAQLSTETPSAAVNQAVKKINTNNQQEVVKRDHQTNSSKNSVAPNPNQQNNSSSSQQQQQQQLSTLNLQANAAAPTAAGSQSQNPNFIANQNQGLPQNPNATAQNTPIVQTLVHSVLPQPMVLQQQALSPAPVRNTGTGTIREPVAAPAPAYLRGGVGPVNVTGASRRKPVRAVDGRNQSTEPPPPH